jgi:glutamine amidotransferase
MGLGVLHGHVRKLHARRVPHMGWNTVHPIGSDPLFKDMGEASVYFANSYIAEPVNPAEVLATTEYESTTFPSVVRRDRTWGVQFHPEKSGQAGLQILRNFLDEVRK